MQETRLFEAVSQPQSVGTVLRTVFLALEEKGYDPVSQMVGYLLSGDPTYITRDVRSILRTVERDEILEELIRSYLTAQA
ncbi:MAG: IreB family regulatory phosphoprotein [Firmicutes bacterium]|jgi:uncharacterized protein (UPF0297 family)|nr:IreB family regulatory phosphoprotein [Bacillota bacterium]